MESWGCSGIYTSECGKQHHIDVHIFRHTEAQVRRLFVMVIAWIMPKSSSLFLEPNRRVEARTPIRTLYGCSILANSLSRLKLTAVESIFWKYVQICLRCLRRDSRAQSKCRGCAQVHTPVTPLSYTAYTDYIFPDIAIQVGSSEHIETGSITCLEYLV